MGVWRPRPASHSPRLRRVSHHHTSACSPPALLFTCPCNHARPRACGTQAASGLCLASAASASSFTSLAFDGWVGGWVGWKGQGACAAATARTGERTETGKGWIGSPGRELAKGGFSVVAEEQGGWGRIPPTPPPSTPPLELTNSYNTPYVAYKDLGNMGRATLHRFGGISWSPVGGGALTAGGWD